MDMNSTPSTQSRKRKSSYDDISPLAMKTRTGIGLEEEIVYDRTITMMMQGQKRLLEEKRQMELEISMQTQAQIGFPPSNAPAKPSASEAQKQLFMGSTMGVKQTGFRACVSGRLSLPHVHSATNLSANSALFVAIAAKSCHAEHAVYPVHTRDATGSYARLLPEGRANTDLVHRAHMSALRGFCSSRSTACENRSQQVSIPLSSMTHQPDTSLLVSSEPLPSQPSFLSTPSSLPSTVLTQRSQPERNNSPPSTQTVQSCCGRSHQYDTPGHTQTRSSTTKWNAINSSLSSISPYPLSGSWTRQPHLESSFPTSLNSAQMQVEAFKSMTSSLSGSRTLQSIETKIDRLEAITIQNNFRASAVNNKENISGDAVVAVLKAQHGLYLDEITESVRNVIRKEMVETGVSIPNNGLELTPMIDKMEQNLIKWDLSRRQEHGQTIEMISTLREQAAKRDHNVSEHGIAIEARLAHISDGQNELADMIKKCFDGLIDEITRVKELQSELIQTITSVTNVNHSRNRRSKTTPALSSRSTTSGSNIDTTSVQQQRRELVTIRTAMLGADSSQSPTTAPGQGSNTPKKRGRPPKLKQAVAPILATESSSSACVHMSNPSAAVSVVSALPPIEQFSSQSGIPSGDSENAVSISPQEAATGQGLKRKRIKLEPDDVIGRTMTTRWMSRIFGGVISD
ncbi:hypothetical protein BG004_004807 [Podila humilis]|nr:hypothetical protein BG004_004807 [Podila humilis]